MRVVCVALLLSACTACQNGQFCRNRSDCQDGETVHHVHIPPQKVIVSRGGSADCAAPSKEGEVASQGSPATDSGKDGKVAAQGEPAGGKASSASAPAAPAQMATASVPVQMQAAAPVQMQAAGPVMAQSFAPAGMMAVPTLPGRPALQFGFKVVRIPIPIPTLSLTETPPETTMAFVQSQPQFTAVQSAGFVAQPQVAMQGFSVASAPMGVQTAGFVAPQQVVAAPQQVVAAPQQIVQASAVAPQVAVQSAPADDGSAELIRQLLELKRRKAAASSAAAAANNSASEQEIKRLEEWTDKLEKMVDQLQKKLEEKNRKAGDSKPAGNTDASGAMWKPATEPSNKPVRWDRAPFQSAMKDQAASVN